MPALNFLRYLLIRDKRTVNRVSTQTVTLHVLTWTMHNPYSFLIHTQTGIWDMIGHLKDKFISPLRDLLVRTRAQFQQELKSKREEKKFDRQPTVPQGEGEEVEMTVEVMGKPLPAVSLEDEINVS